jgi:hypothetical protein
MEHEFLRLGDYTINRECIVACTPGPTEGNGGKEKAEPTAWLTLDIGGSMQTLGFRGVGARQLLDYWTNQSSYPVNNGVVSIHATAMIASGSTFQPGRALSAAA